MVVAQERRLDDVDERLDVLVVRRRIARMLDDVPDDCVVLAGLEHELDLQVLDSVPTQHVAAPVERRQRTDSGEVFGS